MENTPHKKSKKKKNLWEFTKKITYSEVFSNELASLISSIIIMLKFNVKYVTSIDDESSRSGTHI